MKLQGITLAQPAMAAPHAEQASADGPSAQAASQIAPGEALREALASRQAGDSAGRAARRSGMSIVRSLASASPGGPAHASTRTQTWVVQQSDDMQTQDGSTDDSVALPAELDDAIADWATGAVDNASDDSGDGARLGQRPSHLRVSRDGRRQQQRGQSHQQPQEQRKREAPTPVAERGSSKQAAQTRTDGLADSAQACGQPPDPDAANESPWSSAPGTRSTARVAPIAAAAPAQRQDVEPDSRPAAHDSSSDAVAALMWAMAAMVVAIVATLLLTLFSDETHETRSEPAAAQSNHHKTRHPLQNPPGANRSDKQRTDASD